MACHWTCRMYHVFLPRARIEFTVCLKIGAIAAGNCVVLKPSELAPAIGGLIAELIPKYMDSSVIRVVLGAVPETTKVSYSLIICTG